MDERVRKHCIRNGGSRSTSTPNTLPAKNGKSSGHRPNSVHHCSLHPVHRRIELVHQRSSLSLKLNSVVERDGGQLLHMVIRPSKNGLFGKIRRVPAFSSLLFNRALWDGRPESISSHGAPLS